MYFSVCRWPKGLRSTLFYSYFSPSLVIFGLFLISELSHPYLFNVIKAKHRTLTARLSPYLKYVYNEEGRDRGTKKEHNS